MTNQQNGNGRKRFFNPVKIFLRLITGLWEKRDGVSGETYIVNSDVVRDDIEDIADEPENLDDNRNN
nr:hypothetical protein [Dulcicalothrix desertica]